MGPEIRSSAAAYVGVGLAAALIGFGAVYVSSRRSDNVAVAQATGPAAASSVRTADNPVPLPAGPGANPLSQGEMAAFVFKKTPEPLPEITFADADGKPLTAKDWAGKVVLLNLWATWCAPCRKEMPGLDRLQAELGSDKFEVVALAVDRAGADAAKKFLDQIKVGALKLYVDATARSGPALRVIGMPTTLLIDREGREIGRLVGPAEWDGEDAKRLIRAALL